MSLVRRAKAEGRGYVEGGVAFELVAVWLNAKPDKTRDVCAGPVSSGRVEMKSLPVKSAVSSAVSGACGTSAGSTREGTNSTVELLRVVSGDFLKEGVRVCYRRPSPKSPSPKTRQGIHSSVTYPRYNTLRTGRTGGRPPEHTPIPLFCEHLMRQSNEIVNGTHDGT